MKKVKRILALVGAILLLSLYLITFISALTASKHSQAFFQASLFCTIIIPILIYAYMLIYRVTRKKENEKDEK